MARVKLLTEQQRDFKDWRTKSRSEAWMFASAFVGGVIGFGTGVVWQNRDPAGRVGSEV
jgi:hypothetical protein